MRSIRGLPWENVADMTPPQPSPAEMTVKAVAVGVFLAMVFGAANAYLGMKAGTTIAATIPAAVIAIALFRLPRMRGGVLEQNIARTAASVGEALVAGAIFTIPAFMLVEIDGVRLWPNLRDHYWEATLILTVGGLLGVFFIIVLRRPLCVDAGLPWPESVASVQIVRAGEDGSRAPRYVFGAMAFGAFIQLLKSDKGFQILREYAEGFLRFPASVIQHFGFRKEPLAAIGHAGGIPWATPSLSPALFGIGFIIGPRLASINFSGGVIAWWMLIPLLLFFDPDLPVRLGSEDPELAAYTVWYNVVRPIAVGAMLVGAGYTMFNMRQSIARSLRGAFQASARAGHAERHIERTERDIPTQWLLLGTVVLTVGITAIYYHFTQSWNAALVAAAIMSVTGFLLSAVGGYLVGLVGSSNQPVSGLTLSALVVAALVMLAMGVKGLAGVAAVLGVASVVCCACCVSGSLIQDLKAGHLLGGTPWKMQVVEIVTVLLIAVFLMLPIIALHEANLDTGGIGGRALPAPQAGLMAQLAKGIVGGQMAWGLIGIGIAFGFAIILCGARAPMLIAVGMYLPFDTTSAIWMGGLVAWVLSKLTSGVPEASKPAIEERGTLLASGLIAGEAIMGILLAAVFLSGVPSLTHAVTGLDAFPFYEAWGGWLSLLAFAAIAWVLIRIPQRG
ncbi:MAG: oligopeptide transporter, OPT family [Bryobacterales bacterium]|nr:oligopeptide transporter, OPT family [Bryobacterales bacterium]